jgi:hypothetical protein
MSVKQDGNDKVKIKSDEELKTFFKQCNIDVLKIIHTFEKNINHYSYACISCDYVTVQCWLCNQCVSCCTSNVERLERLE